MPLWIIKNSERKMFYVDNLTDLILEIRKTNAQDEEKLNDFMDEIEKMYHENKWVVYPTVTDKDGGQSFSIAKLPTGLYLVMCSNQKYFLNKFGTNIFVSSIRKIFDVYLTNKDDFAGIIINPATDAEILLQKCIIEQLELRT
jgi:ABC-type transport system substrate-binding protein